MKNREREPQRERQRGGKDSDGLQAREEEGRENETERDGEKPKNSDRPQTGEGGIKKGTVRWTEED